MNIISEQILTRPTYNLSAQEQTWLVALVVLRCIRNIRNINTLKIVSGLKHFQETMNELNSGPEVALYLSTNNLTNRYAEN